MAIVYLGIGSNMGNRLHNIKEAIRLLQQNSIKLLKQSTIIETDPVGGPPQDKYLNGVLKIETTLEASELLKTLKNIESTLGRIKTVKDGPRPIDIDILIYDNLKLSTPELIIPHPEMLKRDFVLIPLKEIEPKLVAELTHADR